MRSRHSLLTIKSKFEPAFLLNLSLTTYLQNIDLTARINLSFKRLFHLNNRHTENLLPSDVKRNKIRKLFRICFH